MRPTFILLLLIVGISQSFGQTTIDTVRIYEDSAGMRFKKYYCFWYQNRNHGRSFSYNVKTKQDTMICGYYSGYYGRKECYILVYDRNNNLLLEGMRNDRGELCGESKFYYGDGTLEHTEIWENSVQPEDTCNHEFYFYDGMSPVGTWKSHRKDGTLKTETTFPFICNCNNQTRRIGRTIKHFKRDGSLKRVKYRSKWWLFLKDSRPT